MAVDTDDRTLYVANLHKNVSEDLLYELFLQAGPIERVNIPLAGNKNFRYGFVTYIHECSIDYALELYKGTSLFQKQLTIKRKGEKSNSDQHTMNFDKHYENLDDVEVIEDHSVKFVNTYLLQHLQNPNDKGSSGKMNSYNSNLSQSSLKGHWSYRSKPYDRDSRNYNPRQCDPRSKHQNNFNSDYNKAYKDRRRRNYNPRQCDSRNRHQNHFNSDYNKSHRERR